MNESSVDVLDRINTYYQELYKKLETADEKEAKKLHLSIQKMKSMIESMTTYTKAVFIDNEKNMSLKYMKEDSVTLEDYHREIEKIEKTRKSAHDALIINTATVDRICESHGIPQIYGGLGEYNNNTQDLMGKENYNNPGVKENRRKLANWSFDLIISCVGGLVSERKINRDNDKNGDYFFEVAEGMKKIDTKDAMNFMVDYNKKKKGYDYPEL